MSRPTLIIVSGAPASGKSTLAVQMQQDIAIPLITKDTIKEMLFDTIAQYDRNWSTIEGSMAIAMMYAGAAELLKAGYHVMIESSFHPEYSKSDVGRIQKSVEFEIIEVNVYLEYEERQKRYAKRAQTNRHPGHMDEVGHSLSRRNENGCVFPDSAIRYDTALSGNDATEQYSTLIRTVKDNLSKKGFYETTN